MKAVVKLRDCNATMDSSRNEKIDLNKMEICLQLKKCFVRLKRTDLERLKHKIEKERKARRRVKKSKQDKEKMYNTSHKKRGRKRKNADVHLDMKSVRKKRRTNTDNDKNSQIEHRKSNKMKSRKSKDTKSVKDNKLLRNKRGATDRRLSDETKENSNSDGKSHLKRKHKSSVKEVNDFKTTLPELFKCIVKLPRVKLEDAERLMVKQKKKSVSFLEEVRVFGETDDEDSYDEEEQIGDEVNDYHNDESDGEDVNIIGGIRCVSPSAQKLLEKRCSTPIAKHNDIVRLESPNIVQNSEETPSESPPKPIEEHLSPSPIVTTTTTADVRESTPPLDTTKRIETDGELELITDSPSLQLHVDESDEKTEKIYNDSKDSFVTADEGQNDSDMKDLHSKNSLTDSLLAPNDETIQMHDDNVLADNSIKMNGIKQVEQEQALINQNCCEESIKVSIKLNDDKEADVHNNNKVASDETTKEEMQNLAAIDSVNEEHEQILKNGNNTCNESAENNKAYIEPPETLIDTTIKDNETSEHPNSTSNNNYDENVLFTVDHDEQSSSSSVRFNLNLSRDSNEKQLESSFEKVFNTELNSLRANSQMTNSNNENSGIAKENDEVDTGGGYVRSFERQMSFDDLMHDQTRKLNNISDAIINNDAIMGSPRMIGDDDSNSLLTAPSTNFPKNLNMESQDSVNLDGPLKLSESDVNDDLQEDLNEINKALGMDPNGLDDCDHTKDGSKTSGPGSFSFGIFKTIKNKLFPQTSGKSINDQNMNSNDKFPELDGDNILDLLNINDDELLDTNLNDSLVSTKPDSLLDDEILCNTEFTISK